jgi:hypothetical protein
MHGSMGGAWGCAAHLHGDEVLGVAVEGSGLRSNEHLTVTQA